MKTESTHSALAPKSQTHPVVEKKKIKVTVPLSFKVISNFFQRFFFLQKVVFKVEPVVATPPPPSQPELTEEEKAKLKQEEEERLKNLRQPIDDLLLEEARVRMVFLQE